MAKVLLALYFSFIVFELHINLNKVEYCLGSSVNIFLTTWLSVYFQLKSNLGDKNLLDYDEAHSDYIELNLFCLLKERILIRQVPTSSPGSLQ